MATLVSIIIILAAVLLIVMVFIQNPKGGGLTNDFGTTQLGGVQRANDFVEKATWVLSVAIVVLSITLSAMIQPVKMVDPGTTAGGKGNPTEAPGAGGKGGNQNQQQK